MTNIIVLEIRKEANLFKEGDTGNFFYIVKSGVLELTISDKEDKKKFNFGDTFGELALIQRNKRSGTIVCLEQGTIFCLEGSIFRDIVKRLNRNFLKGRIYFLSFIALFSKIFIILIRRA